MLIIQYVLFAIIGSFSGFLAGFLGIGGGIVVVPSLFYLLNYYYGETATTMQLCVATSLAAMIVTTFFSMVSHRSKSGVEWSVVKKMTLGLILGSLLGAYSASFFKSDVLELVFGAFLTLNSLAFIFHRTKDHHHLPHTTPKNWITFTAATLISYLSTILGIGGGVFSVQFFSIIRLNIHKAIGSASAISFLISLFATSSYLLFDGRETNGALSYAPFWGPVYLPAFISISIFSALLAPVGVKCIYKIKTDLAKRLFGALLFVVGAHMILRAF